MIIYTALEIEDEFATAEVNEEIARTTTRYWGYSYIIGWVTFFIALANFILSILLSRTAKSAENA